MLEGAGEVVALSRSAQARELAREGGAAATLPPDRAAEVDADVVFETAGAAPAIAASFAAVRRGGRVVVLGGHPRTTGLDLLDLTVREVALEGSVSHCFTDFQRGGGRDHRRAHSPGRAARSRSRHSRMAPPSCWRRTRPSSASSSRGSDERASRVRGPAASCVRS